MDGNFDDILKNEAFKNIEPEKIEAVKAMASKIKGKSMPEALAIFNSYQEIFNTGRYITPEERELMIAAILNSMTDENREKFISAMRMVNIMKNSNNK